MNRLERFSECVSCHSTRFKQLISEAQVAAERDFGREFYCEAVPPNTPDDLLQDRIVFTNDYAARLVVCTTCGTVTRDPRFAPMEAEHAYAVDHYDPAWLEAAYRSYRTAYRARMPALIGRIGGSACVLEVGSYVGGFLAAARDCGLNAQGVDVGLQVGEFARAHGLRVHTGSLESAHFDAHQFDAVCIWNCFDQLPYPREELFEIYRVLRPGGWLSLRVPNGAFVALVERALAADARITHSRPFPPRAESSFACVLLKLMAHT